MLRLRCQNLLCETAKRFYADGSADGAGDSACRDRLRGAACPFGCGAEGPKPQFLFLEGETRSDARAAAPQYFVDLDGNCCNLGSPTQSGIVVGNPLISAVPVLIDFSQQAQPGYGLTYGSEHFGGL
jgi:hypothetical protein